MREKEKKIRKNFSREKKSRKKVGENMGRVK